MPLETCVHRGHVCRGSVCAADELEHVCCWRAGACLSCSSMLLEFMCCAGGECVMGGHPHGRPC